MKFKKLLSNIEFHENYLECLFLLSKDHKKAINNYMKEHRSFNKKLGSLNSKEKNKVISSLYLFMGKLPPEIRIAIAEKLITQISTFPTHYSTEH